MHITILSYLLTGLLACMTGNIQNPNSQLMQTRFDLQSITANIVTTSQSMLYEAYFTWADPEIFVRGVSNFDVFLFFIS